MDFSANSFVATETDLQIWFIQGDGIKIEIMTPGCHETVTKGYQIRDVQIKFTLHI